MAVVDELIEEIFAGVDGGLRREFEGWVRGSRRFREFAMAYRSKIRSKLRQAGDGESLHDVRAELETAALFLSDRRFALEYEAYAALKQRGPDFTVTYRVNVRLNVEVRRVRGEDGGRRTMDRRQAGGTRSSGINTDSFRGEGWEGEGGEAGVGKLVGVVCEKVRQMPPSIANLLWLAVEDEAVGIEEAAEAVATVRLMAERKEEDFFRRRGFASAGAFVTQLSRLSGVVVRQEAGQAVWLNEGARHAVAGEVVRAVEGLRLG